MGLRMTHSSQTFHLGEPVWIQPALFGIESHLLGLGDPSLCRKGSLLQPQSCREPAPHGAVYMAALGFRLQRCLRWIQAVHSSLQSLRPRFASQAHHCITPVQWCKQLGMLLGMLPELAAVKTQGFFNMHRQVCVYTLPPVTEAHV